MSGSARSRPGSEGIAIAHIERGYNLREVATRRGCSVTTVVDVSRPVAMGTERVGAGRGWNEEDLTPARQDGLSRG
jgi:hypothetical protein